MNSKRLRKVTAAAMSAVLLASAVSFPRIDSGSLVADAVEVSPNLAKLLQYSMYFYDSNMCGTGVAENSQFTWRGDCHVYDAAVPLDTEHTNLSADYISKYSSVLDPDGDGCVDVAGGYHDAGDHVKFGMPEAYSGSTIGWGYYEFRDAYQATGQAEHCETILRYFNDYFMKCTFRDANGDVIAFCYQVGDGDIDHAYWQAPEIDSMSRPAFFLTTEKPQTDYAAAAAASLAANYLNFKDTDADYANECLDYAKALFDFAYSHDKVLSDNADGPKTYYVSSKWQDDYVWAGAWLFLCTEDSFYLRECAQYLDYYAPPGWMFCWNDVWNGASCLLGEIDLLYPEQDFQSLYRTIRNKSEYEDADPWLQVAKGLDEKTAKLTPGGYGFYDKWGSARYNTAVQLVGLVYDKYKNNGQPGEYSEWALGQMKYLLGDNPLNRNYVVGYDENSVLHPHHRAASGLTMAEDPADHRYVLYGALVGGPDSNDGHNDVTSDWVDNEVTIDYNAAFVGASAGLYTYFGDSTMQPLADFPPDPEDVSEDAEPFAGNNYWVDAYAVDDQQTSGAGVTKLTLLVRSDSTTPKTDISIRYYFSIEEFTNSGISAVTAGELYDQCMVEAGVDGVITPPVQYDASFDPNIYYFEVAWDGYAIANSNKKYQCSIGLYYGDTWNPSNDWSYQDLVKCTDTYQNGSETACAYICVYSDGKLVGGTEPDGTTPEIVYEEANYLRLMKAILNKKPFNESFAAAYDFNSDSENNASDAVWLKRQLVY